MADNEKKANIGMVKSTINYFGEAKAELKKVTWLPRQKVAAYVGVVILISLFVSGYVAVSDFVIAKLFRFLDALI